MSSFFRPLSLRQSPRHYVAFFPNPFLSTYSPRIFHASFSTSDSGSSLPSKYTFLNQVMHAKSRDQLQRLLDSHWSYPSSNPSSTPGEERDDPQASLGPKFKEPLKLADYNVVLAVTRRVNAHESALQLFDHLISEPKVTPNAQTYNALMMTLVSASQWQQALDIYDSIPSDLHTLIQHSAALDCCAELGSLDYAVQVMENAKAGSIALPMPAFNAILRAASQIEYGDDRWRYAKPLVDQMKKRKLKPNVETYIYAMRTIGRGGNIEEMMKFLEELEKSEIKIPTMVYEDLITDMKEANATPGLVKTVWLKYCQQTTSGLPGPLQPR